MTILPQESMPSLVGRRISSARVPAAFLCIIALTGCRETAGLPDPASIALDQSVVAEGTAGLVLATSPTFVVKDAGGNPLRGVKVTVVVTAGGGTLTNAPSSTANGATTVGTWKLGEVAGVNTVTVTVDGLPALTISVMGKAGPPTSIVFITGANQVAFAGTEVAVPPTVQVRDQFGNGVSGVPVSFGIAQGDGSVSSVPVLSDAAGNARSPSWRLGKSAEPQALRAGVGTLAASISAAVQSDYNVDVRFFGPPMPLVASAAFISAAARIRGAVTGDLVNTSLPSQPINLEQCGITGVTAFQEAVDDVIIYAAVATIDGPGRVLAFAGPCLIRGPATSENHQTVVGVMKFDAADLDSLIVRGILTDVIQHEMIHVVGLGTLWNTYKVIAGAGTVDSRFTGTLGIGACVSIGGASVCPGSVPVENTGGPGTADGHWRESVFLSELMTGFVTRPSPGFTGVLNPLSAITIESLADIGYTVNRGAADVYSIPGLSIARVLGQVNVDNSAQWEQVVRPMMELSRTGRMSTMQLQ
ncbi:MAG TPA: leishmanolysin-related zinc metalloendopeptidase [Gemmatimonadaceae bacterium]|nr:leishmanolysin-related zinc metalloendopeptidase [Gemmatimonadaceae bacterium]